MKAGQDENIGEAVLNRLLKDSVIDGIRFGPVLQILIRENNSEGVFPIAGQVYLNLGSKWTVFEKRPPQFPDSEDELPDVSQDEQIRMICDLNGREIKQVELGANGAPHLILTLADERVMFVNGKHDMYECWNAGVSFSKDYWEVIACPGGEVAIGAPTAFLASNVAH